jgi:excisionase family DNA binding protein
MPYEAAKIEKREPEATRQIRTIDEILGDSFFQHKIGRNKLYELVRKNQIPYIRIGRKILFCIQDLENWWDEQSMQINQQNKADSNIRKLF